MGRRGPMGLDASTRMVTGNEFVACASKATALINKRKNRRMQCLTVRSRRLQLHRHSLPAKFYFSGFTEPIGELDGKLPHIARPFLHPLVGLDRQLVR